jgi:large subunit ribosomal protein L3
MKALIGKKLGMTQIFEENGDVVPVTIVDVSENVVAKVSSGNIEIGKGKKLKNVNKADKGNYEAIDGMPLFKKYFTFVTELPVGSELKADIFEKGDLVKVSGVTKGKGFRSAIQRWGFAQSPRSHGASDKVRSPGSLGSRTIPGRVFKGKKMAGHVGNVKRTILNLEIAYVDVDQGLLGIKGSIPGPRNSFVVIKGNK